MALAIRVIPMLLHDHGRLVKGIKFDSRRTVGHALQAARIHQARSVDELLFLDVSATPENREPDYKAVRDLTEHCFMPITAGGGVKTMEHFERLMQNGADKVAIGAGCWTGDAIVGRAAEQWGTQAVVTVIETDRGQVFVKGVTLSVSPVDVARNLEQEGAGEIVLMSRDRDGTLSGYDLETLEAVCAAVDIPVIAAGGCGTYEHMVQAVNAGASGCATGAMLQWYDLTPQEAAKYLQANGCEARVM